MARLPYPSYTVKDPKIKFTINILKLLSYSPATVDHWVEAGNGHFRSLVLPAHDRDLAILYSSARFSSSYEWIHHIRMSEKAGVTEVQREEIEKAATSQGFFANGGGKKVFNKRQLALLRFLEKMIDGPEVDEVMWLDTRECFSDREIVELVSLQVSS